MIGQGKNFHALEANKHSQRCFLSNKDVDMSRTCCFQAMNGLRLLLGTCAGGGVVVCCGGGGEQKDYSIVYLYTCIIGYLYDNSKIKN